MRDLEDGPHHLMLLLAFMRGVFGVLELVGEFEKGVFNVVEAIWRGLAVSGAADRRHVGRLWVRDSGVYGSDEETATGGWMIVQSAERRNTERESRRASESDARRRQGLLCCAVLTVGVDGSRYASSSTHFGSYPHHSHTMINPTYLAQRTRSCTPHVLDAVFAPIR